MGGHDRRMRWLLIDPYREVSIHTHCRQTQFIDLNLKTLLLELYQNVEYVTIVWFRNYLQARDLTTSLHLQRERPELILEELFPRWWEPYTQNQTPARYRLQLQE